MATRGLTSNIKHPSTAANEGTSSTYPSREMVYPWNSPIPLVFVEGDSYEMGTQFGSATKAIVRRNVEFNLPILEKIMARSKLRKKDYLSGVESAISRHTDPGYLDEINGTAEAAGVAYESLLLVNCNVDLFVTLPPADRNQRQPDGLTGERFFCSMFAAWGRATVDGAVVAGHNDDGARIMDQFAVLKVAKPRHGLPFICPQVPGYLAYDCLVNANQVFVCGTAVDDRIGVPEMRHDGVPNWAIYRWLGQYSADVEDAVRRLFAAQSMTLKNWCFIGKDGGKVIEATPRHHAFMRYPSRSKDWVGIATNTVCPELEPYLDKVAHPSSGDFRGASVIRGAKRATYGQIDTEDAIGVLSSHYDVPRKREEASEHTPCRHMEFENKFAGTCRSLVATFPRGSPETQVDVCLGNPCYGHWRRLMFDDGFDLVSGYEGRSETERHLARLLATL